MSFPKNDGTVSGAFSEMTIGCSREIIKEIFRFGAYFSDGADPSIRACELASGMLFAMMNCFSSFSSLRRSSMVQTAGGISGSLALFSRYSVLPGGSGAPAAASHFTSNIRTLLRNPLIS
jgi:hypothetical protein